MTDTDPLDALRAEVEAKLELLHGLEAAAVRDHAYGVLSRAARAHGYALAGFDVEQDDALHVTAVDLAVRPAGEEADSVVLTVSGPAPPAPLTDADVEVLRSMLSGAAFPVDPEDARSGVTYARGADRRFTVTRDRASVYLDVAENTGPAYAVALGLDGTAGTTKIDPKPIGDGVDRIEFARADLLDVLV